MTYKIIDPLQYSEWNALLSASSNHSFFNTSEWATVICETYKYTPRYVTLIEDNKLLVMLPFMEINSMLTGKRGVSLPFSDSCEPIISNAVNFSDLLAYLFDFAKTSGWKSIELRSGKRYFGDSIPQYDRHYSYGLNLDSSEDCIYSKFRNSTKRNIKKAIKEGVKTEISYSQEAVDIFYNLHCLTRKRHGVPPQPKAFFKNIYRFIISDKKGCVIIASHCGRPIAAAVYFYFGENAIYKFGASDLDYQYLRANNLVMWTAISNFARQKDIIYLDMGRTAIDNSGLQQFKSGWGTVKHELCYYKYDINQNEYVTSKYNSDPIYQKIFNTMPICMLRKIGSLAYKHIG